MSYENWTDIEDVPIFLQSSSWEAEIGGLSKSQLLLIADYMGLEVVEDTKKGVLLLKVVETIKSSNVKKDESNIQDESLLLDKQFQLQELEMEKLKMQMKYHEEERKECELDRAREREREAQERKNREKEKKNKKRLRKERKNELERERKNREKGKSVS